MVDAEHENSKTYNEVKGTLNDAASRIPGGTRLVSNSIPPKDYNRGYDRQQLVMFWADNFTNHDFVGFSDTDVAFLTYIDREDLFEDGKPVVNARSGLHEFNDNWHTMPNGTFRALGILEPLRCMSYWPVIINVSHFKDMRDYISRFHGMPFNQAFRQKINIGPYSQFGIMCTYLFTFKRDEYKWYVHTETPGWDGIDPPPNPGQDGNLSHFTPEMYLPKPRIATHTRYRVSKLTPKKEFPQIIKFRAKMNMLMQRGVCMSPPFPRVEAVCDHTQRTIRDGYNHEMHAFDFFDMRKTNSNESLQLEYQKRHDRIKKCNHTWEPNEMRVIMKPENEMGNGWSRRLKS